MVLKQYGYPCENTSGSGPFPHTIQKNNVQKFIDVNIKAKTIQLLEANTGEYLSGLRVGK